MQTKTFAAGGACSTNPNLYGRHGPGHQERKEHVDIYSSKKDVPINENGEKLVSLSEISDKVKIKPMYYLNKIPGSLNDCYAREGAAERLLQASRELPADHYFVIFDAWRPYRVQWELYEQLKQKLVSKGLRNEGLYKELSQFVDPPEKDPMKPSNHLTGGAIDLTIGTAGGLLDMGTGFDDFSGKSHTNAYENLADADEKKNRIRDNRRLLKTIMENAGFTNYAQEWWHYDYGNQSWGKSTGKIAFYGGIIDLKEHLSAK
jgi:D-alanyl-D-alanine dipeptidase